MQYATDDAFINSIVGEGTHFRGHLELAGLLRIDGDFTGSIRSEGKVLIGRNGRADCTIEAATVVIGGVIRGSVYASEKVIVLATGIVLGNIHCPRLIAEMGVLIDGQCAVRGEAAIHDLEATRGRTRRGAFWLRESRVEEVDTVASSSLRSGVPSRV